MLAFRSGAGSKFLRKVELPIVSIDVCSKSTRGFEDLDPRTQFCAGGEKGQLNILVYNTSHINLSITGKLSFVFFRKRWM